MKKKIIITVILVLFLLIIGVIVSFNKISSFNPTISGYGILKILFTDEEYIVIQSNPYKVIVAKPNQGEKTANDLLDEYMYKRGFYKEDRMGSMISYGNETTIETIHFSVNAYYSVWEWISVSERAPEVTYYEDDYSEVMYEKRLDENKIIRVVNKGAVLAQRTLISVEKSVDNGETWISQTTENDGAIQIHNGSTFLFIDENIGFINDPGLVASGDNKGLLITIDGGKTFNNYEEMENKEKAIIITVEKAADIADKEAKKDIYQYQDWNSEFYSRGKNKDKKISADIILGLDKGKLDWDEKWQKTEDYNDRIMWKVRLFDEVDPLTSLYIFIDAISGEVLGAGELSD
ncbi:MAG: hypothetical protein IJW20_04045 [Clostridia bacterium]|nr:hypothetical protein [Clostridia bacterium]